MKNINKNLKLNDNEALNIKRFWNLNYMFRLNLNP